MFKANEIIEYLSKYSIAFLFRNKQYGLLSRAFSISLNHVTF